MKLQMIGLSHHTSDVEQRERLAFSPTQVGAALDLLRQRFPQSEAVLLSTCNRVEVYTASDEPLAAPDERAMAQFLAEFHGLKTDEFFGQLLTCTGEEAVAHLFNVAASLDSMVVGEPQISAQVKQAYETAASHQSVGPLTHQIFQAALRVAKRVSTETSINEKRVSIPSIAVAELARSIFERFDDKHVLVIGAGEMAEETLRYLQNEGAHHVTVVNRNFERARQLAERWHGTARPWGELMPALGEADLVVSTTGADEPIVTLASYRAIEAERYQRDLFILDLAVPRDFDPALSDCLNVYLYSLDDLQAACERNRRERQKEWPRATAIVQEEASQFMAELNHRATAPIIRRLREGWQQPKEDELRRLFNKLPALDERSREEIRQSYDRLINKLLHPPLESLRDEAKKGVPHNLLSALKQLFKLTD
ncbi:MAG: glutamyl-tRNA reductase [Planctomycetes bacterium]|nr:glutamyl-tRNA reductase [Planctomycetota bacterium]